MLLHFSVPLKWSRIVAVCMYAGFHLWMAIYSLKSHQILKGPTPKVHCLNLSYSRTELTVDLDPHSRCLHRHWCWWEKRASWHAQTPPSLPSSADILVPASSLPCTSDSVWTETRTLPVPLQPPQEQHVPHSSMPMQHRHIKPIHSPTVHL